MLMIRDRVEILWASLKKQLEKRGLSLLLRFIMPEWEELPQRVVRGIRENGIIMGEKNISIATYLDTQTLMS